MDPVLGRGRLFPDASIGQPDVTGAYFLPERDRALLGT
jgi:hypothetical protein